MVPLNVSVGSNGELVGAENACSTVIVLSSLSRTTNDLVAKSRAARHDSTIAGGLALVCNRTNRSIKGM